MAIKFLKSLSIKNKTVLLRVDVNVPLDNGKVSDSFRVEQIIPTIRHLRKDGNKIIVCGHLGRPQHHLAPGKPEGRNIDPKFSLKPIAELLANLLNLKFVETEGKIPEYGIAHLIFYTGDIFEDIFFVHRSTFIV